MTTGQNHERALRADGFLQLAPIIQFVGAKRQRNQDAILRLLRIGLRRMLELLAKDDRFAHFVLVDVDRRIGRRIHSVQQVAVLFRQRVQRREQRVRVRIGKIVDVKEFVWRAVADDKERAVHDNRLVGIDEQLGVVDNVQRVKEFRELIICRSIVGANPQQWIVTCINRQNSNDTTMR